AELFGAKPQVRNARDKLIHAAIDLCYHHGFNAVGLDHILTTVGVTKTTFYKHFESKEDLILEAVRVRDEWESQAWMKAVKKVGGKNPRQQLLAMFDVL